MFETVPAPVYDTSSPPSSSPSSPLPPPPPPPLPPPPPSLPPPPPPRLQDANCDQMSISSLTSGDPDCCSLLDVDSYLDPDGFTSPQHGSLARLRRSPAAGFRTTLDSPGTPSRVFRHNSFSGQYQHPLWCVGAEEERVQVQKAKGPAMLYREHGCDLIRIRKGLC